MRRLGGDRAGEIRLTRLLRHSAVTPEAMVAEAGARTAARCAGLHVLAIQDTTVVCSAGGGGLFLTALMAASDGRVVPAPGGVLIRDGEGDIVGAVGISGDTSDKDEVCAVAGIAKAGLKADTGDPAA